MKEKTGKSEFNPLPLLLLKEEIVQLTAAYNSLRIPCTALDILPSMNTAAGIALEKRLHPSTKLSCWCCSRLRALQWKGEPDHKAFCSSRISGREMNEAPVPLYRGLNVTSLSESLRNECSIISNTYYRGLVPTDIEQNWTVPKERKLHSDGSRVLTEACNGKRLEIDVLLYSPSLIT